MLDHLKKDRRAGFGGQERLRLAMYVAGLLALGGFIVIGATKKPAPRRTPATAPPVEGAPLPVLDPAELSRLVVASGDEPNRFSTPGIELLRKLQRTGRWGPLQGRLGPKALAARDPAGARGQVFEVVGRVIDVTREAYRPSAASEEQRLWSVILKGPDGAHTLALKFGLRSNQDEGPPRDAKPPLVHAERIAPGQDVIVTGVYLQQRVGTIGQTVLREPTPVLFSSGFRIELPPEERLAPVEKLEDALWSDVQDRFNRESRRWDEDALFEVVQWARARGYPACRDAVLKGDLGWKAWGKDLFDVWKKEVAVDLEDPRPFTEAARGKVYRVSGIVAEVLQFGWERVARNPWGVDQLQVLTLISDHYRNVALRMILPYPISEFDEIEGIREEHLRVYGVFIKNNTYDTRFNRPDQPDRPLPITVPLFVVLHIEPFPVDEAGRGMRTLMVWVAGAMVVLGLLFYLVLIRGGRRQAERMEAHRWALRKRVRATGEGATAEPPPPGAEGGGAGGEDDA